MPLRNSELPPGQRMPHQGLPGPDQYGTYVDIVVAYVNLLEERIYIVDLELSAMRDRYGHQLAPRDDLPDISILQMEAVRDKNTSLEAENREWRAYVAKLQEENQVLRAANVTLDEENEKMRAYAAKHREPLTDVQSKPVADPFDFRAYRWALETFGTHAAISTHERAMRLLEEALEVAQSVAVQRDTVSRLANHVYAKPAGELRQELGGVAMCLGIMCRAVGSTQEWVQEEALRDCYTRQDVIREKQKIKAAHGVSMRIDQTLKEAAEAQARSMSFDAKASVAQRDTYTPMETPVRRDLHRDWLDESDAKPADVVESRPMYIDGNKIIAQSRENLANYIAKTSQPPRGA